MRVRVFDRENNTYFVSEVYAIVNIGIYTKYLVVQDINGERFFKFFDYLNSKEPVPFPIYINKISENELPKSWITVKEENLVYFKPPLGSDNKYKSIYHYSGLKFIFKQKKLLQALFKGKVISYEEIMSNRKEICTKLDGWNYIETNHDIDFLMSEFGGFHDSVLVSLKYISGSKTVGNGMLCSDNIRQISMVFDGFKNSIEMIFEGTLLLNLRPAKDGYDSVILSATITLKDEIIYFFDDDIIGNPEDYEYTWIKTLGLRWKFLDKGSTL